MKNKRLMVTVQPALYGQIEAMAEQEDRSLAGVLVRLAKERLKQLQEETSAPV